MGFKLLTKLECNKTPSAFFINDYADDDHNNNIKVTLIIAGDVLKIINLVSYDKCADLSLHYSRIFSDHIHCYIIL
jgi:hypothetical protein